MKDVMTTEELAAELGFSPRTVKNWRFTERGPKHFTIHGKVRYRREDVCRWMDEQAGEEGE